MIITTEAGIRIKLTEAPRWNDYYKCYYAAGYRWVVTRQAWSRSCMLHNFTSYTQED